MRQIFFLVLLFITTGLFAQAPSNYTNINGRYRWIAGMFDSTFHIPKGTTTSLRTGGSTNAGALFYRTTDSSVYYYTGTQWLKVAGASGFVPYTGATQNVNLGQFGLTTKFVQFDTSSQAVTDRRLQWSNAEGTLQFGMTNGSTITQRIGLEQFARVRNLQGDTIEAGDVVYVSGASGDRASVKLADNRADSTSSKTLGVATEQILPNDVGLVGTFGVVGKLNLSAFTAGDVVYLDSIPGKLTKVKPQAPYHMVFVGVVERANAGNGLLFVNVQNGYELEELHNVRITSPVRNNAILAYDSVGRLWKDTTLNAIGGITGSGTSGQVSYFNGTNSITSSPTFAFTPTSQLLVNNSVTAASAIARGINATPTLIAAANNDVLVGLDINPTFTNGAFTGVTNLAIRTLSGRLSFTGAAGNGTLNLFTTNSTFLSNASNGVLTFNRNSSSGWQGIEHQVSGALMAYDAITTSGEFRRFANSGGYFQTFYSNGVEAMRLSTSQNLLIGTTTDAGFRLDVNGTARFGNTTIQTTNPLIRLVNNTATNDDPILYYQGGLLRLVDFSSANKGLFINTAVGNASLSMNGSANEATTMFRVHGSITAASAIARGVNLTTTLVAAANNDFLVGLDINPTFTNGAFTGVSNIGARIQNSALLIGTSLISASVGNFALQINLAAATGVIGAIKNSTSTGYSSYRYYNDVNRTLDIGYSGSAFSGAVIGGGISGESGWLSTAGAYPLQLGTNNSSRFIIFSSGTIGINQTTDAGFRLDVNGTARVQGNTTIVGDLSVPSGNYMSVNGTGSIFGMRIQSSLLNITAGNTNLAAFDQSLGSGALSLRGVANNNVSGNFIQLQVGSTTTAALTSNAGTANYTAVNITAGYNITGGTHNIIGIYYDPTLTSMTGVTHRAIQTVTGDVLLGTTSGNVMIGTTTAGGRFTIQPTNDQVGMSISGSSLTGSNAQSLVSLSQTWNTTGNPTAIKLDVTNTASGANSYLLDLQVGGIPQFTVFKGGEIKTSSPAGGVAQTWKLGSVHAVSPTSPDRTIEVEVNGTTYYLHAKTTNN